MTTKDKILELAEQERRYGDIPDDTQVWLLKDGRLVTSRGGTSNLLERGGHIYLGLWGDLRPDLPQEK